MPEGLLYVVPKPSKSQLNVRAPNKDAIPVSIRVQPSKVKEFVTLSSSGLYESPSKQIRTSWNSGELRQTFTTSISWLFRSTEQSAFTAINTASILALSADTSDYIVVDGGTAGLVVASRLTENVENSVLVSEARINQLVNHIINIPAMWTAILGQEDIDWAFVTT